MTFDIKRIIAEKFRHANDTMVTMSVITLQIETSVRGQGRVEDRAGKELIIKSSDGVRETDSGLITTSCYPQDLGQGPKHAASQLSPSTKQ